MTSRMKNVASISFFFSRFSAIEFYIRRIFKLYTKNLGFYNHEECNPFV